ncbi:hypothetical protein ACOMHN_057881 [Nucella lapillus]
MAHDGTMLSSFEEETRYNEKLFRAILPCFSNHMPAMELRDQPKISHKLTSEEMQKVFRTNDRDGNTAAARQLLEYLKMKPHWFEAFMEALDSKDLKIHEFKKKFKNLKDKVDQEWMADHPSKFAVCNPSVPSQLIAPTQVMIETDNATALVPISGKGDGITNDFKLQVQLLRLQKDAAPESNKEEEAKDKEMPAAQTDQPYDGSMGVEEYTDASSPPVDDTYQPLESKEEDENEYTSLTGLCLETDASPVPGPPLEVPEQEVGAGGGGAEPRVLSPQQVQQRRRQRPRTRAEHPSLSQAISRDPQRNFDDCFVRSELSTLPAWSHHQEEHEVIKLIRPNRNKPGYYVIWFWKLAQRPTICVAQGGRVITFVVHKSTRSTAPGQQNKYYINRHQKISHSLKELVKFHCQNGIQYTSERGETLIWLNHPHMSQ